MSDNLVSFAKPLDKLSPYWLLQQLAAIDAILIFRFANQTAHIGYDVPCERAPRDKYLCQLFNAAQENFKQEYIAIIWDLIGLPRNGCGTVNVSEIRIPLYPIFSWESPNGAAAAAYYYNSASEELDKIPEIVEFGSQQHIQRIWLEAILDRISRIE